MAKNKTTETTSSVETFINKVKDETKRKDAYQIIGLMKSETGCDPKMWGPSIVGFGSYHYTYDSGHEGDAPCLGFSPRSTAIVLYLSSNFANRESLLQKLGQYKSGKSCIYIKKLEDVNIAVLKQMIKNSYKDTRSKYPD
jgi:hypothetical protein